MTPAYWNKAKRHLTKADPVMAAIIKQYQGEMMVSHGNDFMTLTRSIVGQQISVKAADKIWGRLSAAVGKSYTPKALLKLDDAMLRSVGLSGQKVIYVREIAKFFLSGIPDWEHMSDEEIIKALVTIKGVGRWTAEMFMIFHLHRPDVLPMDDLGLLKGVYRHYNNGEKMEKKAIIQLAETWRPYRSAATWYLWRVLDPLPIVY